LEIQIAVVLNTLLFVGVKKGVEKKKGEDVISVGDNLGRDRKEGQIVNKREQKKREKNKN
jgi:hypothetical protein